MEFVASRDGRVLATRTGSWSDPRGPVVIVTEGEAQSLSGGDTRETAARSVALRAMGGCSPSPNATPNPVREARLSTKRLRITQSYASQT